MQMRSSPLGRWSTWIWLAGVTYFIVMPLTLSMHTYAPQLEPIGVAASYVTAMAILAIGVRRRRLPLLAIACSFSLTMLSAALAIVHGWETAVILVYILVAVLYLFVIQHWLRRSLR